MPAARRVWRAFVEDPRIAHIHHRGSALRHAADHRGFAPGVTVDVNPVAQGYRVSKLAGSSVTNEKSEKIGTIDDFVIARNRSLFAVLQVGGFIGLGGHLVGVT